MDNLSLDSDESTIECLKIFVEAEKIGWFYLHNGEKIGVLATVTCSQYEEGKKRFYIS